MDERYAKRCVGARHPESALPSCLNVPRIEVSMVVLDNHTNVEVWLKACPYHAYRVIRHALENTELPGNTRVRELLRRPDGRPIRRA